MLAKQLSHILTDLCRRGDLSSESLAEMDQRFEALRGSGRLPRGRENRGQRLTDKQIVSAVLGLAGGRPSWAGMVCAALADLRPVGGKTDAFGGAATLADALTFLLSDQPARESIVAVRLSVAEAAINSHGSAVITCEVDGTRRQVSFVRSEAVSLLQPGGERRFDADQRYAEVARELVLNQRFFDRLAREVETARAFPVPPTGDGLEYDKEDAENARRQRLGVTASSHFLNIGVDNQVTWPREEMLVSFDRYNFVLMPKAEGYVQSIHVDLHANKLTMEEAMTVINRFLSVLTWCDDQFAIAQGGWSGNPVPVPVPRRNLAFATAHQWVFDRDIPASDEAKRALALYREARNAEQNFMVSYAVLNYFKIIEIIYPDSRTSSPARNWIIQNFAVVQDDPRNRDSMSRFLAACGTEAPATYIYKACRVAVSHFSNDFPSDSDDAMELRRLYNAAEVMRPLARHFIRQELGVADGRFRVS